eukprot:10250900-Karenia_brevis.AAC.1
MAESCGSGGAPLPGSEAPQPSDGTEGVSHTPVQEGQIGGADTPDVSMPAGMGSQTGSAAGILNPGVRTLGTADGAAGGGS